MKRKLKVQLNKIRKQGVNKRGRRQNSRVNVFILFIFVCIDLVGYQREEKQKQLNEVIFGVEGVEIFIFI